jgi:type III restriction enzyme
MTTLTLKSYQQTALDTLRDFARAAQIKGPAMAFGEEVGRPYNPNLDAPLVVYGEARPLGEERLKAR